MKDLEKLFSTPKHAMATKEMLTQLQAVMKELSVKVARRLASKASSNVSVTGLKNLASAEDIEDITALYQDFFELSSADEEDGSPIVDTSNAGDNHDGFDKSTGNFGMEVEAGMKPSQLYHALGFMSGLPLIFVKY
ncbi:hypothetical protein C0992_010689 [Termitomyces sp. T32_za158]|nr:hypothetical protein C0992_010689 [Termitomyces sp. T32_za158]